MIPDAPPTAPPALPDQAPTPAPLQRLADQLVESICRHSPAARTYRRPGPQLDLLAWGREYLPAYFRQPPSKMHRWLAPQLDRISAQRGARLNVLAPRGSAKSTLAALAYVLKSAVQAREPYIWIVSATRDQARTHLRHIRDELQSHPRLARAHPLAMQRGSFWRAGALALANGVVIEAYGTGQQLRGRRRRESRPSLIICDDLENDIHVASAAQRALTRDWFHGVLLKAGDDATNIVSLATALHRDALAMQLHRSPGWTSALFRAIEAWPADLDLWHAWEQLYCDRERPDAAAAARQFFDAHRPAMEAGAELLWPEKENLYALMRMRVDEGRTAFEREKQNSPIDPERCEWPEEYFAHHIWFSRWPADLTLRVIALDPSKGAGSRHGDYSAYVLLGIDSHGLLYIEADMARRPTPAMVAQGVRLCRRFAPAALGVEFNQYQELLAGEFTSEFRRQRRVAAPIHGLHNQTNKLVRIRRLGPYLSQQRLRFLATSAATRLLVDQLRDFPIADHDDGPDALEMALRLAEHLYNNQGLTDHLGDRLPIGE